VVWVKVRVRFLLLPFTSLSVEVWLGLGLGSGLGFFSSPLQHYRVRYAACNALGQMANDFAPTLQKKFHDKIIPSLLVVLDDFATPRVQTHAGAALVNFCEQCPKSILIKYLDTIVPKLENVLQVKLREVRKVSYLHFLLNSGGCT